MTKTNLIVCGVILAIAVVGAYFYPNQAAAPATVSSSAGTTFNSAKIAAVNITPSTSSATSSGALYNSDSSARWIRGGFASCTGAGTSYVWPNTNATGLASLAFNAATSSSASNLGMPPQNLAMSINVATTSLFSNNSTSTINGNVQGYWPAGTYLVITANATNTAACTVGVYYFAS